MFTGIIEITGIVKEVISNGSTRTFRVESPISSQYIMDQSVSHRGACLTKEEVRENSHQVTAIAESLKKTNLGNWKKGLLVNLERCLQLNDGLNGHIIQGHVDTTAICIKEKKKSFRVAIIPYTFEHTNIKEVQEGNRVNIEFDMIGKYLPRRLSLKKK